MLNNNFAMQRVKGKKKGPDEKSQERTRHSKANKTWKKNLVSEPHDGLRRQDELERAAKNGGKNEKNEIIPRLW